MDDSSIVELYSAANSVEAHAIVNALAAAGIKARVVGEFLEVGIGYISSSQLAGPKVWVRQEDEARARELLKEWKGRKKCTRESSDQE